ncbi:MAG: polyprenol monophosphomannose synthase [Bacteroidia bacterium]|nr:polyprenol monophosphomannose synthase [Bacteroidia bacterium]MDW8346107.1 polyprenol monophosphomannose synthase [Bacteroidia bacterium]
MHKVLVIIPTYNEVENIERMLHAVMQLDTPIDVLVVDDNSQDGTADAVKNTMLRYPNRIFLAQRAGKLGLGTAYIHGFKWALQKDYEFICEMDADFSHNPADLPRLVQACINGADVAIGSRYKKGVNVINWPMSRVLMSYFASKYVKFITRLPVHDATAGFVCYRREVLEKIDLDSVKFVGYAFQIEMKFKAWKHGFILEEIPIIFTDRTAGQSKMSMKIFLEAFFGVIKLKVSSWFKKWN